MMVFGNRVRGFSLVLRDSEGSQCRSWWRKIDKTGREITVVTSQILDDISGYQLGNLKRILTFVCYTRYKVEGLRQLLGIKKLPKSLRMNGQAKVSSLVAGRR
jgi:hypothetical protein